VKKAEDAYLKGLMTGTETKEYDSIDGYKPFRDAAVRLLYGNEAKLDRVASAVCLSGTGSLRVAAELFAESAGPETPVYFSRETWPNHAPIFLRAGLHNQHTYRYFDGWNNCLDTQGMLDDLWKAPDGSIVILHLCGHNPTGVDPTEKEWEKICALAKMKHFRVLFDSAYQGYATGDLDRDALSARMFAKAGIDVMACQSFSKNMGLYGDRLGCFSLICDNAATAAKVQAFIKVKCLRPMWSSPPRQPSRIAHKILTDPLLRREWEEELLGMANRIKRMRQLVYDELVRLKTPGRWNHVVDQIGMFSFLGLSPHQCRRLVNEFHIYILESARASMAGLTEESAPRLARAIDHVVRDLPNRELYNKSKL